MIPAKLRSSIFAPLMATVFAAGLALLGWSLLAVWQGFDDLNREVDAEARLELTALDVSRLSEETRTAAELAVLTGQRRFREAHILSARNLGLELRKAGTMLPAAVGGESIGAAELANAQVLALETEALAAANQGKIRQASAILASAEIRTWHRLFDTNLRKTIKAGQETLLTARNGMRGHLQLLVAAAGALALVLMCGFAAAAYVLRRQAVSLASIGARLASANLELESRVLARTADLEAQRQKFRDFAETSSDWFWETDETLAITNVSDNFSETTGIAKQDFTGLKLSALTPSDRHAYLTEDSRDRLAKRLDLRKFCVVVRSPTRGQVYLRMGGRAVRDDAGKFLFYRGTASDITADLARARAAQQGQKLQALGTMAAGLAHEFNNILSIVLGYTESLRNTHRRDADTVEQLTQIAEAGRRGTALSKSLLSFGRSSRAAPREVFNVRALSVELPQLLKPVLGAGLKFRIKSVDRALWVDGERDLLLQSIVSLVINARDAMPSGGEVAVSFDVEPSGSPRLVRAGLDPDCDYAVIAVTDTGVGMDAEAACKLFEPAVAPGPGDNETSVSLSVVHSFVKSHRGFADVDSAPTRGTTVSLLLPISPAPAARAMSAKGAVTDFTGLRVLLVDDEPQLVTIFETMLRGLGFDVVAHTDLDLALEVLDDEREKIDIVVSDVLMPQMSGFRFADLARSLRPSLVVLFVSGQTERGGNDADPAPPDAKSLGKPFDRSQLSAALGELLQAKQAA